MHKRTKISTQLFGWVGAILLCSGELVFAGGASDKAAAAERAALDAAAQKPVPSPEFAAHPAPPKFQPSVVKREPIVHRESARPAPRNYIAGTQITEREEMFGIRMISLPAGRYTMGCQGGRNKECYNDEKPAHSVQISAFELGKTEVTQGEWKAVMGSPPPGLYFKDCGDTCPVERVSWDDIQTFIQKLNVQTGKTYRLPSEAEWEYACRAGQSSSYCGGDNVDSVAWYTSNSGSKTHPVGGKQSNAWGLYDMNGNVWEWVQDTYHNSYKNAPSDGRAWESAHADARVLRGGAWDSLPQLMCATNRFMYGATGRFDFVGFRVARTLP